MGVIYRQKTDHVIFARFLLNFFLGFVQNYFCVGGVIFGHLGSVVNCENGIVHCEYNNKTQVIANCEKARNSDY